jgi:hypothetical protein
MIRFGWIALILIMILTVWITLDNNRFYFGVFNVPKDEPIPENEWKIVQQADTNEMVRVEWDQKYGETKAVYCRVVFQNASQYKLVAPWVDLTIEKANTNNIKYAKELFDSVKIKK